jgi:prephenate dehydrogenase/chorismate mutase
MNTLPELREQLDVIDTQILQLLEQRFRITDEVAVVKNRENAPLTDQVREDQLIARLKQKATHPALKEYIEDIYRQIMELNKKARLFNKTETIPISRIGIIGLGMIGGSIVKALKSKGSAVTIATLHRDSDDHAYGREHGYIDTEYSSLPDLAEQSDLLILATPINVTLQLAEELSALSLNHRLIVMDVASVKAEIARQFETLQNSSIDFVATHPMAGSEQTGFANAKAMMFVQKPWVITRHSYNSDTAIETVESCIRYMGSLVEHTSPEEHDKLIASVSHLVFIAATALFAFCNDRHPEALKLAGSGFESTTRLASGSADMHAQIVYHNQTNIASMYQEFITFLQQISITDMTNQEYFGTYKQSRDRYILSREE